MEESVEVNPPAIAAGRVSKDITRTAPAILMSKTTEIAIRHNSKMYKAFVGIPCK